MILDRLFGTHALSTPGPTDDFWYGSTGAQTLGGVNVDETSALNYSAVWAATRIIAETTASMPLIEYERLTIGGKRRADDHYLYPVLHDAPNPEMDSFSFWESRTAHLTNWGNCFAEKETDGGGRVRYLWPIHPSRIPQTNIKREAGKIVYYIRNDNGSLTRIAAANMLHIVGTLSEDGMYGKGVIRQARESIGMGLATERFGASFFGNNARPGGILEHPSTLTAEAAKHLRESWDSIHGGPSKAHKLAVLEQGLKYHVIDVPPEDAQFLQSRQFNITEIARWYRLPPHILADSSRSSFSNIESEQQSFIIHSIRPWLVRIERACNRQLLSAIEQRTYFVEFLMDALLRGDTLTRATASQLEFMNGEINLDEWRARENRNPLPDGKGQQHFVPQNLQTIERAIAGPPEQSPPVDEPLPDEDDEPDDMPEPPMDDMPAEPEQNAVADLFEKLAADNRATHEAMNSIQSELARLATQSHTADVAASEQRVAFRKAAGEAVAHAARRMLYKESSAARRAAGKPREFVAWLDEFYGKHGETLTEALGPALATARAAGVDADTSTIVAAHVARSRNELLAACECQADELLGKIEACVSAWDARADGLASGLLGDD